jgi:hypothetical protein
MERNRFYARPHAPFRALFRQLREVDAEQTKGRVTGASLRPSKFEKSLATDALIAFVAFLGFEGQGGDGASIQTSQ